MFDGDVDCFDEFVVFFEILESSGYFIVNFDDFVESLGAEIGFEGLFTTVAFPQKFVDEERKCFGYFMFFVLIEVDEMQYWK